MNFAPVDILSLFFLLIASLFLLFGNGRYGDSFEYLGWNSALAGLILLKGWLGLGFLAPFYLLGVIYFLYLQMDVIVESVHGGSLESFERKVERWNVEIFRYPYYLRLSETFSGRLWHELFNFLYLSYYALLVVPFFVYGFFQPEFFGRFAFVAVGMFGTFMTVFIWLPVAGPLSKVGVQLVNSGFFPKLVRLAYKPVRLNGINSGAFPSSHVGMSVGLVLLISPQSWLAFVGLWLLVLGIAVSTVYGRFHYSIDALAGLISGFVFYFVWSSVYSVLVV